jgi:hypothetical protein
VKTRWLIAALALAAGCSTGPPTVGARFRGPTAVAPFMGFTAKRTTADGTPSPYLAVASSGGDELRIIDVADDLPALGPGVVFPLSVPTAPRPMLLASASLGDGKADLLVVVSAGSNELQLVRTWSPDMAVTETPVSLGLDADARVLSVRAMTVAVPSGAPSRARVVAGASGGRLCVVDFERAIDPATQQEILAPVGAAVVKELGFDPVDIATPAPDATLTPDEAMLLFLATPDPVATVGEQSIHGVARVASTADASEVWTVTALDAKAPTVAVAAAKVSERSTDPLDPNAPEHYDLAPALRVYAVLDRSGCGQDQVIDCGVVTLKSSGGGAGTAGGDLESDPTRSAEEPQKQMPHRAPMQVPGVPVAIAIAKPVKSGAGQFNTDSFNPVALPNDITLQRIAPGSGQRSTTAVAAVPSSDGRVYLLDLARWGLLNDSSLLKGADTRVAVTSPLSFLPTIDASDPDFGKGTPLGLWNDFPANAKAADVATAVNVASDMNSFVQVTPGYTDSDTWTIAWQGVLPQLATRDGVLVSDGTTLYAALQSADGQHVEVQAGAPELGVLPGDLVEFPEYSSCGLDGNGRRIRSDATVAEVLPPSPSLVVGGVALPGGALRLAAPLPCQGVLPVAGVGASPPLRLAVRAAKLVLTSTKLGLIGRPEISTAPGDDTRVFRFEWQDESPLSGMDLIRVRKARRHFYPSDPACASLAPGCYEGLPWLADPLDPGPALAFKVGLFGGGSETTIPRGAYIQLDTRSGIVPSFRKPVTGGTVPGNAVPYDKTGIAGHENDPIHFYVPFLDDQVIDFSPAESSAVVKTIR